ncbi:MAG: SIS domain-containing protein [Pseudomonadota bacterium]
MSISLRIQDQFIASIQTLQEGLSCLEEPIEQAVETLTACLMSEGKILVCGQGASGLAASHMAAILAHRFERDRLGLAALALSRDGAAMMDDTDPVGGFARQVAALGQPGDVLVVVSMFGEPDGVKAAVRVAQERELRVVALCGGEGGSLAECLTDQDVLICVPVLSAPRVVEAQFVVIHCLCDGIDYFLLGA